MRVKLCTSFALALLLLCVPNALHAQDRDSQYPLRAVKIIVPFPAGGTADILPRIVAEKLRDKFGQPFVIENRSGAGGNIGAEAVSRSDADGYTLLASPPGPVVINESLYANLGYRSSDFEPIIILGIVPNVLAVRSAFPAKTVGELIAFAKANPEKITYASQGNGSTSHLTAVMFQSMTGLRMVHVPYRGTAPALQDLIGGNVDLFFDNLGSSLSLHQSEKIRILAVGSADRVKVLPGIVSIQEAGVSGFQSITWFALMAPAGTPRFVIDRLNSAILEILQDAAVSEQFTKMGVQPMGATVPETRKFIEGERVRWRDVVRSAGLKMQ
ncbi:Bug family tripartite tricarboxylate transporter substrate binding protein [Pseudorhodoplanes sp.]|uniref:Bug family tripartite tricarboxylate transporter substrate binding protein n=1 Tax=Pseudorhodoplanes sp. TaxID=1934341 RepID=UPI003D0B08EA